jgi:hypothetical protein
MAHMRITVQQNRTYYLYINQLHNIGIYFHTNNHITFLVDQHYLCYVKHNSVSYVFHIILYDFFLNTVNRWQADKVPLNGIMLTP